MSDVNGSRYHLLFGPTDWRGCTSPGPRDWRYAADRNGVTLLPIPFVFPQPSGDRALTIGDRRGATRDRYGHWYSIDPAGEGICARWAGAAGPSQYWASGDPRACLTPAVSPFAPAAPPPAPTVLPLSGLAATTGHYLVAGTAGKLLLFDLHTGGAPLEVPLPPTPGGEATSPFDLAPLPDGGLLVLDRDHRIVWHLDRSFRPVPPPVPGASPPLTFQPEDPAAPRGEPQLGLATPLALGASLRPISIEPLPDGTLLILDRPDDGPSVVRRYRFGQDAPLASVPLLEEHLREAGIDSLELGSIVGHDFAFVPDAAPRDDGIGTLFVVGAGGNQAFGLRLGLGDGLTLRIEPHFFPLRAHTGKALVAPLGADRAYYDQGEDWRALAELPRERYRSRAILDSPVWDSREPGCTWHRFCLDACLPPTTGVVVYARAADEPDDLAWSDWETPEPIPYRRSNGAEIPYFQLWGDTEVRQPHTGTWEVLLQRARGRYLQVRLELTGDGRSTPLLRAVRAHYPRFSYLRAYLPALYGRDRASADFLERFLANPEGMLTTLEGLIGQVHALFDPRAMPAEAVEWLADWIGLACDPAWTDYQRRLLLANAPAFYQRRGTPAGIGQLLQLALEPTAGPEIFEDRPVVRSAERRLAAVRLVEHFWTRHYPRVALGDPTEVGREAPPTGDPLTDARARAHRFTVLLPTTICRDRRPGAEQLVERLVAQEKPAHTAFTVRQFWALFRVGEARLGEETLLGEGGRFVPLRLGSVALAEGALGTAYPENLRDRTVLAR